MGIQVTSHFPGIVWQPRHRLGFCAGSAAAATALSAAIRAENIEARPARLHPDGSNQAACDVELPCWPNAAEEHVDQAVLAVVKASHPPECAVVDTPRPVR